MRVPMDIIVQTTVVVTVWTTLHVTRRLVTVIRVATLGLLTVTVAKVSLQINAYMICFILVDFLRFNNVNAYLNVSFVITVNNIFQLIVYQTHFLCIECLTGHFGLDCKKQCSGQCANSESCNHISGVCHSGCQDGYIGNYCNSCKKYLTVIFI